MFLPAAAPIFVFVAIVGVVHAAHREVSRKLDMPARVPIYASVVYGLLFALVVLFAFVLGEAFACLVAIVAPVGVFARQRLYLRAWDRVRAEIDRALSTGTAVDWSVLRGSSLPWNATLFVGAYRATLLARPARIAEFLDGLDGTRMLERDRLVSATYRLRHALATGQIDSARILLQLLAAGSRYPDVEVSIRTLRTFVTILDGDTSPAVLDGIRAERARAADAPTSERLEALEAHLFAARGDEATARAAIEALRAKHGEAAVARLVAEAGPASRLASTDGPYR